MNWVLFRVDRSSSVIGPSCVSTHTSLASPTAVIILLYVNNDHASDIIGLSDFRHLHRFSICTVRSIIKTKPAICDCKYCFGNPRIHFTFICQQRSCL